MDRVTVVSSQDSSVSVQGDPSLVRASHAVTGSHSDDSGVGRQQHSTATRRFLSNRYRLDGIREWKRSISSEAARKGRSHIEDAF